VIAPRIYVLLTLNQSYFFNLCLCHFIYVENQTAVNLAYPSSSSLYFCHIVYI
jgi:hypothetical protein